MTVLGKDYLIPSQLGAEEAAIAGEIYIALEPLVPARVWAKFIAEYKQDGAVYRLLNI